MLYLFDADTLISSHQRYYPIKRFPQVWLWLVYHFEQTDFQIPIEIYEEIKAGNKNDKLRKLAENNKDSIVLNETADIDLVNKVLNNGYGLQNLEECTDEDIEKFRRDPFLVSYALNDIDSRCVVTFEVSRTSRQGANSQIPDVCSKLGIRCLNLFELVKELDFRTTDWNDPPVDPAVH